MISKWSKYFLAALIPALAPAAAEAERYNLQTPQSAIAQQIYDLHTLIFVICCVIFVLVFGVMTYSIIHHRKSVGHKADQFHENTMVEIAWTVVPFIILIGMAIPATKTVLAMKDTSNPDVTIKATGYQWKWGYDYLHEGVSFYSALSTPRELVTDKSPDGAKRRAEHANYLLEVDNPVVVPVGKKIRIITTANDVIHSWAMPALGVKQDAIPGFVRDTWFRAEKVGDFHGQCQELCGKEHAYMPIHVKVLSQSDYTKWVEAQRAELAAKADDPSKVWELADLIARGEKIYSGNCAACHQPSGKGGGAVKPLDGAAVVLDADKTKQIAVLLNGQNAMPSWKQLSDTEIAAVITYTKNNWSNKTGQLVQPSDVVAARH